MVAKPKDPPEPRRLNRTVAVSDALSGVLDAALKKRGFATRDIITNWKAMAPKPYDLVAVPDQLKWPRGAGHEGATLLLRCAPSHALGAAHEGALIAAAVNRYFGYFLVREVRLSAEPFAVVKAAPPKVAEPANERASEAVGEVADAGLKEALEKLGSAVLGKRK